MIPWDQTWTRITADSLSLSCRRFTPLCVCLLWGGWQSWCALVCRLLCLLLSDEKRWWQFVCFLTCLCLILSWTWTWAPVLHLGDFSKIQLCHPHRHTHTSLNGFLAMLDPVGSHNYVPEREIGVLTKQRCKQQTKYPMLAKYCGVYLQFFWGWTDIYK